MTILTVTSKGQITLRKDLLRHLGVEPGDKIEISELPGGRIEVKAARPAGTIGGVFWVRVGTTDKGGWRAKR